MQCITRSKSLGGHPGPSAPQNSDLEAGSPSMDSAPHSEPLSPQRQLHEDSLKVLALLDTLGIDLGTFIHGIFYGNSESRENLAVRRARNSFIQADKLRSFLGNIYKPPRPPRGKGRIPTTACRILHEFSVEIMCSVFSKELTVFSDSFTLTDDELVDPNEIARITSSSLYTRIKMDCKYLTRTLESLTGDDKERDDGGTEALELDTSEGDLPPINPHPHFVSTQPSTCCFPYA